MPLSRNQINVKDMKTSEGRRPLSANTTQRIDGFAGDDNNPHADQIHKYTFLHVKLASFFHLNNELFRQHLESAIISSTCLGKHKIKTNPDVT